MSYRIRSFALVAILTGLSRAGTPAQAGPQDWLTDADAAARPVTYAAVPLPPAAVGSVACVGLVLALRFSRHRRWVTLR